MMLLAFAVAGLATVRATDTEVTAFCRKNQPATFDKCAEAFDKVKSICEAETDPKAAKTCWQQYNRALGLKDASSSGSSTPPSRSRSSGSTSTPEPEHHHGHPSPSQTQKEVDAYCKKDAKYYGTYKDCEEHFKQWEANCKAEKDTAEAHKCWEMLHEVTEFKKPSTAQQVYDYCGAEAKKAGDKKVMKECEERFNKMEQRCEAATTQKDKEACWKRIHDILNQGKPTTATTRTKNGSTIKDATKGSTVEETTKSSSVKETTKSSSVKETTKGSTVEETTKGRTVKEATKGSSVKETTKGSSVKETTKGRTVKEATKGSSVKETTKGRTVEEATKGSSVKETTKGRTVKEATPEHPSPSQTQKEIDAYCKKDAKYYGTYKDCEEHYKKWEAGCKKEREEGNADEAKKCWEMLHEVTEFKKPSTAQQVYDYCGAEAKKAGDKKVMKECEERFDRMEQRCEAATTQKDKEACWQRIHDILNGKTNSLPAPPKPATRD